MMHNDTFAFLLLAFLALTFLQSGYEKLTDWKGTLAWLSSLFSTTFLHNKIFFAVVILVVLEVIAGGLCLAGIVQVMVSGKTTLGHAGAVFSCISLLCMLFGQRLVKDYDGARTIVIYFIPTIMAVYLL